VQPCHVCRPLSAEGGSSKFGCRVIALAAVKPFAARTELLAARG
jgi:hypothetical protein